MKEIKIFHLNDITMDYAEQLAQILNIDERLRNSLGSKKVNTTGDEFITYSREWMNSRNADMFVITLDKIAIGSISLSHQQLDKHKARIGYWLSSRYWGKGYTSQAFFKVLDFARSKKIEQVCASIEDDNLASKRIWEKYGAQIELEGNRYNVTIELY